MRGKSNFNSGLFIENATEFLYFKCLDIIEQALERKEAVVECNLYAMITLPDLRALAGYECEYSLLDEHRDKLLTSIMSRLKEEGISSYDTYLKNPYMPAAFTVACTDMSKEELEAAANDYVVKSEGQKVTAAVSALILFLFLYNAAITALICKGSVHVPSVLQSDLPQSIMCIMIIFLSISGLIYYQRRNIKAVLVKNRISRRSHQHR